MVRILFVGFLLIVSVFLYALSTWFDNETVKVHKINRQHTVEIRRLHKITKINNWLDTYVKPYLAKIPTDANQSDDPIINFFDKYATDFQFQVDRYIYKEKDTHNLKVNFVLALKNKPYLEELMKLQYPQGFLQFTNFQMKDHILRGDLLIVQPYYGENNASHK